MSATNIEKLSQTGVVQAKPEQANSRTGEKKPRSTITYTTGFTPDSLRRKVVLTTDGGEQLEGESRIAYAYIVKESLFPCKPGVIEEYRAIEEIIIPVSENAKPIHTTPQGYTLGITRENGKPYFILHKAY